MKKQADTPILATDEPIGIIISRGASGDDAPAMFAYQYCEAPETSDEPLALAGA
jgi:hypothetical protein